MGAKLADVSTFHGGAQYSLAMTFEREGSDKPCCVAEGVFRIYM